MVRETSLMTLKNLIIPGTTACLILAATLVFSDSSQADSARDDEALSRLSGAAAFQQFIDDMRSKALKRGISAQIYNQATRGLKTDPRVVKLSSNQPEFNTQIWKYLNTRVSSKRITTGRQMKARHAATLAAISKRYGVDRHILLAIWGMETNYGSYKGNMSIVRSLATIGYQGRRAKFGRKQLLAALDILQKGDIPVSKFTGSWAGAMGHTQFIPTTYNSYAVDWTGDGKRDIWNSVSDALASTANYLSKSGWKPTRPWGWEVTLPKGFNYNTVGPSGKRTTKRWKALGVKPARGKYFGTDDEIARLILPAGAKGPAFLITQNFKAILAYNASVSYALAVGHLADRIAGKNPFRAKWPINDRPLSSKERHELQKRLTAKGFDTGGITGRFGRTTSAAIKAYQRKTGLVPDGYANHNLLNRLRNK